MQPVKRFIRSRGGNFALWLGVSAVPVLGAAGLATTYSMAMLEKSQLQQALDAAVLAGTKLGASTSEAERVAAASLLTENLHSKYGTNEKLTLGINSIKTSFAAEGTSVIGLGLIDIANPFSGFVGPDTVHVTVQSKAIKQKSVPICLHALNREEPRSLEIYGNAELNATNCAVMVNSKSGEGIDIRGAKSSASALEFGVTGSFAGKNIKPEPTTDVAPVDDIYAALPVPKPGACVDVASKLAKATVVLGPGTYCGGINISPGSDVTLSPGIYIMKDGPLRIGANSTLKGSEVLIALVGANSVIESASGSAISLTSPANGTYTNIQFMSDRVLDGAWKGEEWTIISASELKFDGVMHLPEQKVWIKGSSTVKAATVNMAMVADQFFIQDASSVEIVQENERGLVPEYGPSRFEFAARLAE